jgi:hypothetical protein
MPFDNQFPVGKYFSCTVLSSTTAGDQALTLLDSNQAAITLLVGDRIIMDNVSFNTSSPKGGLTVLYLDKNGNGSYDAGEEVAKFQSVNAAYGNLGLPDFEFTGLPVAASNVGTPRVVTSTASEAVYVTITGRIVNGG